MLHDQLLDCLEARVRRAHPKACVQRNIEYGIRADHLYPEGELDLCRYTPKRLVVYEVKGNHTNAGYRKAKEQIRRFKNYVKPLNVIGVYVTPERIKRIY